MRVVVIPARYGSERFEGKVLADLGGKPVIRWVYEGASSSRLADLVVVATDDERVKSVCEAFGAEVVMTSQNCPSGTDRVAEAVRKLSLKEGFVVNVQGDEPFIRGREIDMVFEKLSKFSDEIVTLAVRIEDEEELRDPNAVKVVFRPDNSALYFSRSAIPYFRRPGVAYRHVGIYGYSVETLLKFVSLRPSVLELTEGLEQLRALENGIGIRVFETDYKGLGIDTPADLEKARRFLKEKGHED